MNKTTGFLLALFTVGSFQCHDAQTGAKNTSQTDQADKAPAISRRTISVSGSVAQGWIGDSCDSCTVLDYVRKAGGPLFKDASGLSVTDPDAFLYTVIAIDRNGDPTKTKSRMGSLSSASTDKDLIDAVGIYVEVKGRVRGIQDPH